MTQATVTAEALQKEWHDFKEINDRRIDEMQKKGGAEALTLERLERINANIERLGMAMSSGVKTETQFEAKSEARKAYTNYIRSGDTSGISKLEKSATNAIGGGINIEQYSYDLILQNLSQYSVLRKIAAVQAISGDSYDITIESNGGEASWGDCIVTTTVSKKFLKVHELVAQPKMTSKLLEDAQIDTEKYVAERIADSFAQAEDNAFINGNGANMPSGLLLSSDGLSASDIQRIGTGTHTVDFNSIATLQASLNPFYGNNVSFLMNGTTENTIRFIQDGGGRYIWSPAQNAQSRNTILGTPVYTSNYMPSIADGHQAIVYGNFTRGYAVVDRVGGQILRDPYTEKPFVKFYTLKNVGGGLIDGRALKILKIGN